MPGVRAQHDSQRVARQAQEGRHHRQDDVCLHVQIQQAAVRPRLYLHPPVQAGIHRPRGHRGHSRAAHSACSRNACARNWTPPWTSRSWRRMWRVSARRWRTTAQPAGCCPDSWTHWTRQTAAMSASTRTAGSPRQAVRRERRYRRSTR